jgi:predicted nuclease of restriction endonuclease-like (RecB) superfamily
LVPWGHHVEILKKIKESPARFYYLRAIAQLGWTRAVPLNQIKGQAFERALVEKKPHNFPAALPEHFAEQAEDVLKSRYDFSFLGVGQAIQQS